MFRVGRVFRVLKETLVEPHLITPLILILMILILELENSSSIVLTLLSHSIFILMMKMIMQLISPHS